MSNLADKILERRDADEKFRQQMGQQTKGEKDDLGFPVPDPESYDYLVARTIKQHPQMYKTEDGRIMEIGRYEPYMETLTIAYQLIGRQTKLLKGGGHVLYWRRLKQYLPMLDDNRIQISEHLFWDKEQGKLIKEEK